MATAAQPAVAPAAAPQARAVVRASAQPMFFAALAFATGAAAALHWWRPLSWLAASAGFIALATAYLNQHRPRTAWILALAVLALLGAIDVQLERNAAPRVPDVAAITTGDEVVVTAHVVRTTFPRDAAFASYDESREVMDVESEEVTDATGTHPLVAGLRVSVYARDEEENSPAGVLPAFHYGERIRFAAKPRLPRNYGNAGAMDYVTYLRDSGIHALTSTKAENIERLPGFSGSRWGFWRWKLRTSIVEHMLALGDARTGVLRLSRTDAGLLAAMVIGESSLLERSDKADFQRTGAYHLLVVSGMNVAILAYVLFWCARRLRLGNVPATVVTIALSLFYAYVTDLGTPVLRAAVMLALYLAARLFYRESYSLNSLGTAALVLLVISPRLITDASFQLTFLAVVALGGIAQPILERTVLPYSQALRMLESTALDLRIAPKVAQFRIDLRMLNSRSGQLLHRVLSRLHFSLATWEKASTFVLTSVLRIAFWAADLIVLATVMQFALALPMTWYFHRVALLGVPTNIIVVPLTGVLMPAAIAAVGLSYPSLWLAKLPAAITALSLHAILFTVRHFGGVHFADVRVAMPTLAMSVFCAVAFVWAMFALRKGRGLSLSGVAALLISAAMLMLPHTIVHARGALEITAIDVGQGDALLVVTPEGRTLLIDAGGPPGFTHGDVFDIGENVVAPYLWARGISRLDMVMLTHGHSDHLGGMQSIVEDFHPRELWVGPEPDSVGYKKLLATAALIQTRVVRRECNEHFAFGSAQLQVVAPPCGYAPATKPNNNDSLALLVRYGSTSALLSGDMEKRIEEQIAPALSHIDMLKVGHHGSGTSTTPELLQATTPSLAVISVGYRNVYHHPRADVIDRLRAAHVQTFRTDMAGAVTFIMDGKTVRAETRVY